MTSSSPRDERPVAGDDLGQQRVPARRVGGLTTNPPLAPTGTMTAFFTVWAFISPRISVRKSSGRSDQRSPPRATVPTAQVHALDPGRVDEDLEHGPRQGQVRDAPRVELQREPAPAVWTAPGSSWSARWPHQRAAGRGAPGPRSRLVDQRRCGPRCSAIACLASETAIGVAVESGSNRTCEQFDQPAAIVRIADERRDHVVAAERGADLAEVLAVGAQHGDLAAAQPGTQHEPVEPVVLDLAAPHRRERLLEALPHVGDVQARPGPPGAARSRRSTPDRRPPAGSRTGARR